MRKIDIFIIAAVLAAIVVLMASPDFAKAKEKVTWNDPVQCSYYTPTGSKCANGYSYTWNTKAMRVAVPYDKIVSKKTWKKGSKKFKQTHFYYGEKLELKHSNRTVKVKVVDCGGFGYSGQYYKGKWL